MTDSLPSEKMKVRLAQIAFVAVCLLPTVGAAIGVLL